MRVFRQCLIIVTSLFLSVLVTLGSANADGHKGFKLGVVTFLSGPAAEPFGVPAWNGGKLFIDLLNAGKAPLETWSREIKWMQFLVTCHLETVWQYHLLRMSYKH